MKDKYIVKRHVLADKIPLIAAAVLMLLGQYGPMYVVASVFELVAKESQASTYAFVAVLIILSLLMALLFKRWFYPEYEGSLGTRGIGKGLVQALPLIIFIILCRVIKIIIDFEVYEGDWYAALLAVRVGVNEEIYFRAIAVALVLRAFRRPNNIWVPAVFTGVFFGCTHLLNMFSGDVWSNCLLNSLFAAAFGVVFGVLFTMSGNAWPIIFLHALYDYCAFTCTSSDAMPASVVYAEVAAFVVIAIIYVAVLIKKKDSYASLWDRKWKNPLKEADPSTAEEAYA